MSSRLRSRRRQFSARLYILRRIGLRHARRRHRLRDRYARMSEANAQAIESMWRDAAASLGAAARRLSGTLLEFELEGVKARIRDRLTTPLTDRVAQELAMDKPVAYQVLAAAGVPVPEHAVVEATNVEGARAFLERAEPPLIVKPASGGGGTGIVGNIYTLSQLRRSLVDVGRYHSIVLVEEQAAGDSYRLLFLDGELLDVLRRPRPRIVGDGVSTVEAMMFREYRRRLDAGGPSAGYPEFEVDLDSLLALDRCGVGLRSVLAAGQAIVVKSASNYAAREDVESIPAEAVPGVIEPARAAAAALGVRLAGVDVVTTDPSRPLAESGFVLEVNPVPGLLQHYCVAEPRLATPVATIVLAALLGRSRNDVQAPKHQVAWE